MQRHSSSCRAMQACSVPLVASDVEAGAVAPASVAAAAAMLEEHGVMTFGEPVLSPEVLHDCQEAAQRNFNEILRRVLLLRLIDSSTGGEPCAPNFREIVERDGARFDVRYRMDEQPFGDLHRHSAWWPVVQQALGTDAVCLFTGMVVALGAMGSFGSDESVGDPQTWHADGSHLYAGDEAVHLPCHCLNVFVPLVDLTAENGATQFLPGTHKLGNGMHDLQSKCGSSNIESVPQVEACVSAGSAIMFDYRVWHRGGANVTKNDRIMLYFTFAKPWFADPKNHRGTESIFDSGGPLTPTEKRQKVE